MRFHGVVGYGISTNRGNGVWTDDITERTYMGTVLSATRNLEASDKVNDDIRLQNRFSIMADAFALEHFLDMKYIAWQGKLWKVASAEAERPRIVITAGGVYNGPTPEPAPGGP